MKIMDILVKDAVILDLASKDKRSVLEELAGALARAEPELDAERLLQVLLEREELQSTGIGDGVAIPHEKTVLSSTSPSMVSPTSSFMSPMNSASWPGSWRCRWALPNGSVGATRKRRDSRQRPSRRRGASGTPCPTRRSPRSSSSTAARCWPRSGARPIRTGATRCVRAS